MDESATVRHSAVSVARRARYHCLWEPWIGAIANEEVHSRLRKKAFRTLLSLSVISPRGGELKE